MAAYEILVGHKGDTSKVIVLGPHSEVNAKFKALRTSGGEGFDSIEIIQKRRGLTKRKRFPKSKSSPEPKPAAKRVKPRGK